MVVRILLYGLMAFSVPETVPGTLEAVVYDARQGGELLPGIMVHEHEFSIRLLHGQCRGNGCTMGSAKAGRYRFSIPGSASEPPAAAQPMSRLPSLPEPLHSSCRLASGGAERCGTLAEIELPGARPFVCHQVHDLSDRSDPSLRPERLEYALADLGDKRWNFLGMVYKPMGDVVEVRYEAAEQPIQILWCGGGCAQEESWQVIYEVGPVLAKVDGQEAKVVAIAISNAPPEESATGDAAEDPESRRRTMDVAAHYSLLYDTVFPGKGEFEEFPKRRVPVHWGHRTRGEENACEDLVLRLAPNQQAEDGTRVLIVPHRPAACIPPRYQ